MRIWFYGDSWTRGDEASEELNDTHSEICQTHHEFPYVGAFTETIQSELGIQCINRGSSGSSNMCSLMKYLSDLQYRTQEDFVVLGLTDYYRLFSFSVRPGQFIQSIQINKSRSETVFDLLNHSQGHLVAQIKINNKKLLTDEEVLLRTTKMVCDSFMHLEKRLLIFSAFLNYSTLRNKKLTTIMREILNSTVYESFSKKHSARQYLFDHLDNCYSGTMETGYEGKLFTEQHHPNSTGYKILGKYLASVLSNRI